MRESKQHVTIPLRQNENQDRETVSTVTRTEEASTRGMFLVGSKSSTGRKNRQTASVTDETDSEMVAELDRNWSETLSRSSRSEKPTSVLARSFESIPQELVNEIDGDSELDPMAAACYSVPAASPERPVSSAATAQEEEAERERLMVEHLPIVRYLAWRIHKQLPQHVDMEDLVGAGVVGLIDAFSKFDPAKKVQFRSYAQFRIRGAILDSMRALDWAPRDLRGKGRAVDEAIRTLTLRYGRPASDLEVSNELNLDLTKYHQLLAELKGLEVDTLHVKHNEDSPDEELVHVPGKPEDDPLFQCLRGEVKQRLAEAIAALPERERLVMTHYYYGEMTMKEIGLALGVVESRVSQQRASAIMHLRALLPDLAPLSKSSAAARRAAEERRRKSTRSVPAVTSVQPSIPKAAPQAHATSVESKQTKTVSKKKPARAANLQPAFQTAPASTFPQFCANFE
jgi:RNA polymerase sigma factor for flagellar operon FliA